MRRKIVAGNWKMNKTPEEAQALTIDIVNAIGKDSLLKSHLDVVIAPPYVNLERVGGILCDTAQVYLGAQNCHYESKGAFTGETSVEMLKAVGCKYVIVGHSERRSFFNENDELLKKKTDAVLNDGLTPIFCCGEVLSEREQGLQEKIVGNQIKNALCHLNEKLISKVVIAYEPVWAIGTGVTASPLQAQEMHAFIRQFIAHHYNSTVANGITILYGGSCNAKNAAELFSNPDVDGGLIGGASLIADDFVQIVNANK